jgi:hypothetical protein
MRIGIVLTVTFNLPLKRIQAAGLQPVADGTGDLPLTLGPRDRIAWLHLWPHVRPWKLVISAADAAQRRRGRRWPAPGAGLVAQRRDSREWRGAHGRWPRQAKATHMPGTSVGQPLKGRPRCPLPRSPDALPRPADQGHRAAAARSRAQRGHRAPVGHQRARTRRPDRASRSLRFEDRPDGSVAVIDANSGAGGSRRAGRGRIPARRAARAWLASAKRDLGSGPPFELLARADGRLTLPTPPPANGSTSSPSDPPTPPSSPAC